MVIQKLGKLSTREAILLAERYIQIRDGKRNATTVTFRVGSHENMFELSRSLNERLNLLSEKDIKEMTKELKSMMKTERNELRSSAISFLLGLNYQILRPQESVYGI